MKMKFSDGNHFKYISFKESIKDTRIYALYINEMYNVEIRFEALYNAKVFDRVSYNRKTRVLRDMLLSIKVGKTSLFVGVEQRLGSDEDNIFLLTTLPMRNEVQ